MAGVGASTGAGGGVAGAGGVEVAVGAVALDDGGQFLGENLVFVQDLRRERITIGPALGHPARVMNRVDVAPVPGALFRLGLFVRDHIRLVVEEEDVLCPFDELGARFLLHLELVAVERAELLGHLAFLHRTVSGEENIDARFADFRQDIEQLAPIALDRVVGLAKVTLLARLRRSQRRDLKLRAHVLDGQRIYPVRGLDGQVLEAHRIFEELPQQPEQALKRSRFRQPLDVCQVAGRSLDIDDGGVPGNQ